MSILHDSDSKTDAAYQTLRREILSARLAADMALRPQALKETYGLSWTPVREALARLEAERLVVYKRNHGFAVAPISSAELDDLQRARQAIELPLLMEAMEHGDADWEAAVVAAHYKLSRSTLPIDDLCEATLSEWERLHYEFHMSLLQAAVSKWLLRFQAQIYEQLQRHHRVLAILPTLTSANSVNQQARAALREAMGLEHHTALMHAVLARDVKQATRLMAEHAGTTMDVFEHSQQVQQKLAQNDAYQSEKNTQKNAADAKAKKPRAKAAAKELPLKKTQAAKKTPPKRAAKPALVIVMDKENREALQTAGKRVATTGAAPQRKTRTATAAKSR